MPIRVNTMTDIGRIIVQKACAKRHLKQKSEEKFGGFRKSMYLCIAFLKARAFSSAGLEHLPYKQRVGGSNPSTPTRKGSEEIQNLFLFKKHKNICCAKKLLNLNS